MDQARFDQITRALGAGSSRRNGLKAALAALLGTAAPALAGRDDRDRARTDGRGDDAEDAKRRKRCKPVGGRCRKAKRCCTGWCFKTKPGRKRRGVCQCREQGQPCTQTTNCCAVGDVQLQCLDGVCGRLPVATGQACAESDTCADERAACTTHRRTRDTAQTLCLLGANAPCTKDQACISLTCENGRCVGGPAVVPTGDACIPGQDICASSAATCEGYAAGSGGTAGTHCVLPNGDACEADRDCAAFACTDGICGGSAIPTGEACVPDRDRCLDEDAVCRAYAPGSGGPAGAFCTLSNGKRCESDGQCYVNDCKDRTCGRDPVPTGKDCDPARDTCRDEPTATCRPYDDLPGVPAGDHCVVPNGEACTDDRDCAGYACADGVCGSGPVPTGRPCVAGESRCADPAATCAVYDAPGMPGGTFCLLRTGAACEAADVCEEAYCNEQGACGPCALIPSGSDRTCASNAECCSGVCEVAGGVGRCIGPNQVYFKLSWTQPIDIDTWLWMPVGTPNASGTADNFPLGGDLLNYEEPRYPARGGGPYDAWTDVDDTEGPGEERTIILRPIPGGTYRFAAVNFSACSSDRNSENACGDDWWALDQQVTPLSDTDATVEFYVGGVLTRTFRIPTGTPAEQPATHFYWWNVADVSFDRDGNYAGISGGDGEEHGALRDCMPNPYAMVGTFPMGNSRSNYCTPAAGVPTGDACTPGEDACRDPRAACVAFDPGSGGAEGTFCLLPSQATCAANDVCTSGYCASGRCVGFCGMPYEGAIGQGIQNPFALCDAPATGRLYVADSSANRIQVYENGALVLEWGQAGSGDGEFSNPRAVVVSADGQRVYVADRDNDRVQVFDADGVYQDQWPAVNPSGLALTSAGLLAVSEQGAADSVSLYATDGTPTGVSSRVVPGPGPLAVGLDGTVYAVSYATDQVYILDGSLEFVTGFGYGFIGGVASLAVEPAGTVLVPSSGSGLLYRYSPAGQLLCRLVPEQTGPDARLASVATAPDGTVYLGAAGPQTVYVYQGFAG